MSTWKYTTLLSSLSNTLIRVTRIVTKGGVLSNYLARCPIQNNKGVEVLR